MVTLKKISKSEINPVTICFSYSLKVACLFDTGHLLIQENVNI